MRLPFNLFFLVFCLFYTVSAVSSQQISPSINDETQATETPNITMLKPDARGGKAYRLTYLVSAPIDVFWLFKTDFDNDFLITNKYIHSHVFIKKEGPAVITENTYSDNPKRVFRWRTLAFPKKHRLTFELINPKESGQTFHYGYIQLKASGSNTQVTQVAYFDFWGVSLWVKYPWQGGMEDFLMNTARWEQQTVLKRRLHYSDRVRKK